MRDREARGSPIKGMGCRGGIPNHRDMQGYIKTEQFTPSTNEWLRTQTRQV